MTNDLNHIEIFETILSTIYINLNHTYILESRLSKYFDLNYIETSESILLIYFCGQTI